jgi:hypothetical protein
VADGSAGQPAVLFDGGGVRARPTAHEPTVTPGSAVSFRRGDPRPKASRRRPKAASSRPDARFDGARKGKRRGRFHRRHGGRARIFCFNRGARPRRGTETPGTERRYTMGRCRGKGGSPWPKRQSSARNSGGSTSV